MADLSAFAVTGSDNPHRQVSVTRWNSFLDGIEAAIDAAGPSNVKVWGAVGDGVTDDTAALQAALDGASAIGRGALYIPAGTYIVSGTGLACPDNMRIVGEGRGKTILKKKLGATELYPILCERVVGSTFQPLYNLTVENIEFYGNGDAATPGAKGAGLLRAYAGANWRIIGCSFHHSRGYGMGMEGALIASDASKRGPTTDFYLEDCHFYSNGLQAYLTGPDTDDGIDFKTSDRVVLVKCRAWDNGDKGFDFRCRMLTMFGCYSSGNVSSGFVSSQEGVQAGTTSITPASALFEGCWSYDNGGAGFSIVPQVTVGVVDGQAFITLNACHAVNNSHNISVASQSTLDLAKVRLQINGMTSRDPVSGTRHYLASAPCEVVKINGGLFYGGTTHGITANSADVGHLHITGATFENIGGSAIVASTNAAARTTITGCTFRTVAVYAATVNSNLVASGNNYEGVAQTANYSVSGTNNRVLDRGAGVRTVASAATVTLPEIGDFFAITGTTAITSITASYAGRRVVIRFAGIMTLTDGGNLILAGNFVTANNSTAELICDGTNWYELGRSTN